jgi:hypothetical protein
MLIIQFREGEERSDEPRSSMMLTDVEWKLDLSTVFYAYIDGS